VSRVHPIKVELARRGESQRACADAVGVSANVLNRVLCYRTESWPALRRRLAEHLEMPEDQLFASQELV
jgi:transcriptional regulator with XRE-family HTH domain